MATVRTETVNEPVEAFGYKCQALDDGQMVHFTDDEIRKLDIVTAIGNKTSGEKVTITAFKVVGGYILQLERVDLPVSPPYCTGQVTL